MATSGTQEIKKQEALVSFSIISYKTRLSTCNSFYFISFPSCYFYPWSTSIQ